MLQILNTLLGVHYQFLPLLETLRLLSLSDVEKYDKDSRLVTTETIMC